MTQPIRELNINLKVPLNIKTQNKLDKTSTITKFLALLNLQHIDGKALSGEQYQLIRQSLNNWFREIFAEIKTFDGTVFQKLYDNDSPVIIIGGNAYIQLIKRNSENSWMWESIEFNNYFLLSEIIDKGIVPMLANKIKKMFNNHKWVIVNYYYFCLKHDLIPIWDGWNGFNTTTLYNELKERIQEDIEALTNTYFLENYQDDYIQNSNYNPDIHKDSYLYDLMDEAREEYQNSTEELEDRKQAMEEIIEKYINYSNDEITAKVCNAIRAEIEEIS